MKKKGKWKQRFRRLRSETYALYLAYRDPRTPWYAKALAAAVVAYALSPIDLIPDFIPVLGHLDDLLIVPLGIRLSIKLIPGQVMRDARRKARKFAKKQGPVNRAAAYIIAALWISLSVWLVLTIMGRLKK